MMQASVGFLERNILICRVCGQPECENRDHVQVNLLNRLDTLISLMLQSQAIAPSPGTPFTPAGLRAEPPFRRSYLLFTPGTNLVADGSIENRPNASDLPSEGYAPMWDAGVWIFAIRNISGLTATLRLKGSIDGTSGMEENVLSTAVTVNNNTTAYVASGSFAWYPYISATVVLASGTNAPVVGILAKRPLR